MGNLTRDPELTTTGSGIAVCHFGMAVNRTYIHNNEKKDEACFVEVTVLG